MPYILRFAALAAFVGIGLPDSASAQSMAVSFSADGRLGVGVTNHVPGADLFFFGDATAKLSLNNSPLGFQLGVYGLANIVDTPHETYGTFTWDFAEGGRLLFGVPRPAYDSFAVSALDTLFPSIGVARTHATRSLATYGAMFDGYLPYGVRFETAKYKFRFAASIDTVPNRDTTIAGVGFALRIGEATFESAVEVTNGMTTEVSAKVQLSGDLGRMHGGLGFYLPDTVGGQKLLEASASFEPTEKITVAGVVQVPVGGENHPVAVVSVRYVVSPTIGLSAAALRDADATGAYSAFLDWRF